MSFIVNLVLAAFFFFKIFSPLSFCGWNLDAILFLAHRWCGSNCLPERRLFNDSHESDVLPCGQRKIIIYKPFWPNSGCHGMIEFRMSCHPETQHKKKSKANRAQRHFCVTQPVKKHFSSRKNGKKTPLYSKFESIFTWNERFPRCGLTSIKDEHVARKSLKTSVSSYSFIFKVV